jgi:RNA polymerase sigma factor (sigma-70 family)
MALSAQDLAQAFEETIWSLPGETLSVAEPALEHFLDVLGVRVPAILAELCDEVLIESFRKGFFRRLVFEVCLHHRYERPLRGLFYQRTQDFHHAQDLVQELYLKLLDNSTLERFDPTRFFRPWLFQVARNLCVDDHRRTAISGGAGRPDESALASGPLRLNEFDLASAEAGPVEQTIGREVEALVNAAITNLPEDHRRVIQYVLQDVGPAEIARRLGLVRSQVYRLTFLARRGIERALARPDPSQRGGTISS